MPEVPLLSDWFARPAVEVAPDLVGKVLVVGGSGALRARIVETEAYDEGDPASHSNRGITKRNAVMFGPAGFLYVYFTYGMHWCMNLVCAAEGRGEAVLLRAAEPLDGTDQMWAARPAARRVHDLLNGPAKLCQALGIDGSRNGLDVSSPNALVRIVEDGSEPVAVVASRRIGIRVAIERPWRFLAEESRFVSRPA